MQESSLRFDERATLLQEADSGETAVVPGDAAASELLRRVMTDDESERMPPEGKPLSEAEIAALTQWIEDGAEYVEHWAFQPVQTVAIPAVASGHQTPQRTALWLAE